MSPRVNLGITGPAATWTVSEAAEWCQAVCAAKKTKERRDGF
jgi:hypothetical protein